MSGEQYGELIRQHIEIAANIERLWYVFVVLVFLGLVFLGTVIALAAWSVNNVNKRQGDLEGKFGLLIEVLLTTEGNRRSGRAESV